MAPTSSKPAPRKRNRKRKRRAASSSSSSESSSSSSSEEDALPKPSKPLTPKNPVHEPPESSPSSSSSESDSDSSSESSAQPSSILRTAQPTVASDQTQPIKATSKRRSPSPPPPDATIPSFIPFTGSEENDAKKEQLLKDRFRKFWMTSVAEGFHDDLEEIRKVS